jgi:hypothetical protein
MQGETDEEIPDMNRRARPRAVPDVMVFAARRSRTLDEHNFAVDGSTFRLQLFEASGARPVAIATQRFTDGISEGQSLTNGAETYAAAVWQQYFPDDPQPPVWVELLLLDIDERVGGDGFKAVAFTVDADHPHQLYGPKWQPLRPQEVAELVGGEVDATRGERFIPAEPPAEPTPYFSTMYVLALPPTEPFRQPECMPTTRGWRLGARLLCQVSPQRAARSCCWYHGGDWQRVSDVAIGLVRGAEAEHVDGEELWEWASERLEPHGLTDWESEALLTLFNTADAIQPNGAGGYINGQHRAQAMLDQGVRRTVVCSWRWPQESSPAGDGDRRDD